MAFDYLYLVFTIPRYPTLTIMPTSWQDRAKQKREGILAAIPSEWRIKEIPSVDDQKDVTGEYIRGFLSDSEVEITETTAEKIAEKTTTGQWKAEDVARAFCHRAALAHQLVGIFLCIIHLYREENNLLIVTAAALPARNLL